MKKLAPSYRRFWFEFKTRKADLKGETEKFLAYQDDHCAFPEFGSDGKPFHERLPSLLIQAAILIKETGWSEETVMTLPLGKVIWYNSAFSYLRTGETTIVSDAERAAIALLTQQMGS